MSLNVSEIFFSIQGESSYAGLPCVFVRLAGCNLRCSYCDTNYAYNAARNLEISDIIARVRAYGCSLVEITGGEPLFQEKTPRLIQDLLNLDYKVMVETNGSYNICRIDHRCIKIVDIKCPSSGEADRMDLRNLARLKPWDELKLVIGDKGDYGYAKEIFERVRAEAESRVGVLFSPVFDRLAPARLVKWILQDRLDVRFQLQLHKFIWPLNTRGV